MSGLKLASDNKMRKGANMQNWEYEIVTLSGKKDEDMIPVLEHKGKSGWELVSVVGSLVGGTSVDKYLAFFKRRVG